MKRSADLWDRVVIFGATLLLISPLLFFSRIPTQDGPLHVDTARVMLASLSGPDSTLDQFYNVRWMFGTNTLGHNLLVALLCLTPNPLAVEKTFQFLYLFLFSGGAIYLLNACRYGAWRLAPLLMLFALSYPFHLGFYNNCLSVCGFLWCWGALLRVHHHGKLADVAVLVVATVLTWMAHPVGADGFLLGAFTYIAAFLIRCVWRGEWASREARRLGLGGLISAGPAVGSWLFLSGANGMSEWRFLTWSELGALLTDLTAMDSFGAGPWQRVLQIATPVFAVLLFAAFLATWRMRRDDGRLAALAMGQMTLFYLAVYFFAPTDAAGSGYINERVMPFIFLQGVTFLGCSASAVSAQRTLMYLGMFALGGLQTMHWPVYEQSEVVDQDYLFAMKKLPAGSVIFPLSLESHGYNGNKYASGRADAEAHLAGFYASSAGGVDLNNSIARWDQARQIAFKPEIQQGIEFLPPALPGSGTLPVDLPHFERKVGRPVDYVLLYGNFSSSDSNAGFYERVVSKTHICDIVSPMGLVKLCRKRDSQSVRVDVKTSYDGTEVKQK